MDVEGIVSQCSSFVKKYWLPLALGILGLIFFVYGLIGLFNSASNKNEITISHETQDSKSLSLISVDVEGAIVSPGVYRLSQDSIVQDALVAAKGLSKEADREWVSKNINLAAKLSDGAKLYIPKVGENPIEATSIQSSLNNGQVSGALININTASSESLDTLPGIGPATATKIINSRPYTNINQLLDKKVVSSKVFTEIKDKITAF